MYSITTLLVLGGITTIIGVVIGLLVAWHRGPASQVQHQLRSRIAELEQQQATYRHQVSEHFADTATLLAQLASSYRDVHNHLAQGAHHLATAEASERLQELLEGHAEEPAADISVMSPPLDYAVTSTTYDTVVVDEHEHGPLASKKTPSKAC